MLVRRFPALLLVLLAVISPWLAATGAGATPCPSVADYLVNDQTAVGDFGWSGHAHARAMTGWKFRMALSGCVGVSQPGCGQCSINGLLPNAGGSNHLSGGRRREDVRVR